MIPGKLYKIKESCKKLYIPAGFIPPFHRLEPYYLKPGDIFLFLYSLISKDNNKFPYDDFLYVTNTKYIVVLHKETIVAVHFSQSFFSELDMLEH